MRDKNDWEMENGEHERAKITFDGSADHVLFDVLSGGKRCLCILPHLARLGIQILRAI